MATVSAGVMATVGAEVMATVGAEVMATVGAGVMVPVGTPLPFQGRGRGGVLTALNVMSNVRSFKPLGKY